MLTRCMNLIDRQVVAVMAMLIAFAWASLAAEPVRTGNSLPLPADYVASSAADVVAN